MLNLFFIVLILSMASVALLACKGRWYYGPMSFMAMAVSGLAQVAYLGSAPLVTVHALSCLVLVGYGVMHRGKIAHAEEQVATKISKTDWFAAVFIVYLSYQVAALSSSPSLEVARVLSHPVFSVIFLAIAQILFGAIIMAYFRKALAVVSGGISCFNALFPVVAMVPGLDLIWRVAILVAVELSFCLFVIHWFDAIFIRQRQTVMMRLLRG